MIPFQTRSYKDAYIYNSSRSAKMMLMAVDSLGDTLWQKNYFNHYKIGLITKILPAPAGRYLVGDCSYDTMMFNTRMKPFLMYVDNSGEVIWKKDDILPPCTWMNTLDAKLLDNGDVVIIGYYREINPEFCTPNPISFAIRLNPDGVVLWHKSYTYNAWNFISKIGVFPNGNLLFSGGSSNGNIMALLVNAHTGDLLQLRDIAPSIPLGLGQGLLQLLSDGSMMVTGHRSAKRGYLARLDANFNILWERIGKFRNRKVYEMLNGYFLLESYDSSKVLHLHKMNIATGDTVWSIKMGTPVIYNNFGNIIEGRQYSMGDEVIFDGKGNATIAGTYINWDYPQPVYTSYNFFTAKLKDVGVPLTNFCQQGPQASFAGALVSDTLKLNSTSISNVTFHDTLQYQWFVGGVALNTGNQTLQQSINVSQYPQGVPVKLVITNHWGCKDSINAVVTADGVVGNKPDTHNRPYLRNAYPNPSGENVNIRYTLPAKTQTSFLRVYELSTGRTVAERNLSALDSEVKFNVSSWATGVYAYQLFINGAPVAVKRMTISR